MKQELSEKDKGEGMKTEIWECSKCGSPCRIEIQYTDEKLPQHLRGESRLRFKGCICRSAPFAFWRSIDIEGQGHSPCRSVD